jgi:hypothetical protein
MSVLNRTYRKGFQLIDELKGISPVSLPVGSGVAITKGDLVTFSSGYLALYSSFSTAGLLKGYVALDTNTAAEASSSGAVYCRCIPMLWPLRYIVPVGTDAVLAQATHIGYLCILNTATTGAFDITDASSATKDSGFLIEQIDISAKAIVANTYGYAIGRFSFVAETT